MVIKVFKYATWTNANSSQEINSKEEVNWFNVQEINASTQRNQTCRDSNRGKFILKT